MPRVSASFVLLFCSAALACAAAAQPPAARENLFPPWPALWSNSDTKPRDCHLAVVEPSG